MRGNSNVFMYVVGGIILLHFLVGFIWLFFKLSKKKDKFTSYCTIHYFINLLLQPN